MRSRAVARRNAVKNRINITPAEIDKAKAETDVKVLKKWAESRTRKTRLKAAMNENTPKTILRKLKEDSDGHIALAAKNNPSLHSADEDKILTQARSSRADTRLKAAKNPNATPRVLAMLVMDDNSYVRNAVVSSPNIDKGIIDFIIKNMKNKNFKYYHKLVKNSSIKREWLDDLIPFLGRQSSTQTTALRVLENSRFFSNEDEWLELLDLVLYKGNVSDDKWKEFISKFYGLAKKNYEPIITEKTVMKVIEYFGDIIKGGNAFDGEYSDAEYFCDNISDLIEPLSAELKAELYLLHPDDKFLPQDARDIFLF